MSDETKVVDKRAVDLLRLDEFDRVVVCLWACEGIRDPAKAFDAAREALEQCASILSREGHAKVAQECRAALSLLTPEKKP